MVKKYTFKDWLDGKIDNNDVTNLTINEVLNRQHGSDKPYLPVKESRKIRDYQKLTFDKAVEITATTKVKFAQKKVGNGLLKNPENWLRLEIDEVERFIKDNPELEKKYEENKKQSGAIKPIEAKRINEMYKRFENDPEYQGYAGFSVKKNGKYVPQRLTDMYINKIYLPELKKLINEIGGRKSKVADNNQENSYKPVHTGHSQKLLHELKLLNAEYREKGKVQYSWEFFREFEAPVVNELVSNRIAYNSPVSEWLKDELLETVSLLQNESKNSNAGKIQTYCDRILQHAFNFNSEVMENNKGVRVENKKPHKDDVYEKFGEFKAELGVKSAFYKVCEWIEDLGYDVSDYIRTDTPENFNKSYGYWIKRK